MATKAIVSAVFIILAVCSAATCSSSGSGVAPQTCGTDNKNFYCPQDKQCKPRNQRCTGSRVCQNANEVACYPTTSPGQYEIRLGHSYLFGSSGSGIGRKKRYAIEHQFVMFRGLTYEFGKSYGVQILDTLDPKYKYVNNKDVIKIEKAGSSYCTWEDATRMADSWDTRYKLFSRNCQDFAKAMIKFLTTDQCNQPSNKNGEQKEDQKIHIDTLINEFEKKSPCSGGSALRYLLSRRTGLLQF